MGFTSFEIPDKVVVSCGEGHWESISGVNMVTGSLSLKKITSSKIYVTFSFFDFASFVLFFASSQVGQGLKRKVKKSKNFQVSYQRERTSVDDPIGLDILVGLKLHLKPIS